LVRFIDMAVAPPIAHFGLDRSGNLIHVPPGYALVSMPSRPLLVLGALLAAACGGASAPSGPCGVCPGGSPGAGLRAAGTRSEKVEHLALERVELARKRLVQMRASFEHGSASLDELFDACRDVAFAARDSGISGEKLRRILAEYRDAAVALRDLTRERLAKGAVNEVTAGRFDALVAEAEFWLAEASDGI
jgi:hypothetical protein